MLYLFLIIVYNKYISIIIILVKYLDKERAMEIDNKVAGNYGADQIQVLEGLEHIRKRPGMYIASTDARGLHPL